mgnify:CR=1 FL=1
MKIEVDISRPVNPAGVSFIKTFYAVLVRNGVKPDKNLNKAIQRVGFKIEELVGVGSIITGKFLIDLDNKKIMVQNIQVWKPEDVLIPAKYIEFDI